MARFIIKEKDVDRKVWIDTWTGFPRVVFRDDRVEIAAYMIISIVTMIIVFGVIL